jgi:transposase-like protein
MDSAKEILGAWRLRSLDPFYPVLFLDTLVVNIKDDGHIAKKSIYLAVAIRVDGQKELLGL